MHFWIIAAKYCSRTNVFWNSQKIVLSPASLDRRLGRLTRANLFKVSDSHRNSSANLRADALRTNVFRVWKNILLGSDNAATDYLNGKTNSALYSKFTPVVKSSLNKVGADNIWSNIISKYNALPFSKKVNPDLTDYVSQQALSGVFKMISVEEANIRNQYSYRNSDLLKKVFALQD